MTAGNHAVVIGAGIAGLCAAQVLADSYERVTLLDRDALPSSGAPRSGVPQGRHVHAVLALGNHAIRQLFPGLVDEFIADGVPAGDMLSNARFYNGPHRLVPVPSGFEGIYIGRPDLEHRLRDRVCQRPNVTVVPAATVVGLTTSTDGSTVTGVRVKATESP